MAFPTTTNRVLCGTARLRRGHPLLKGLLGAWVFPHGYGKDLVGSANLIPKGTSYFFDNAWGFGNNTSSQSASFENPSPAYLKIQPPLTLVWQGYRLGTGNANDTIFGLTYTSSDSNPYLAYAFNHDNIGRISYFRNNGSLQQVNGVDTTNGPLWLAVTDTGTVQTLYINDPRGTTYIGALSGTVSFASSVMVFGQPNYVNNRNGGLINKYGLIYNRALSLAELQWLYAGGVELFDPPRGRAWLMAGIASAYSASPVTRFPIVAERVPQSQARRVPLQAYLSSDHYSPATGKTIAVQLSRNGGPYADPVAGPLNATEIGHGSYYADLPGGNWTTLGPCTVRGTAAGIDDALTFYDVVTVVAQSLYKGQEVEAFPFPMVLTDHITPALGKTVTGNVSKDGAAEVPLVNSATIAEVSHGSYTAFLVPSDTFADTLIFRFSAAGCDDCKIYVVTQPPESSLV